MNDNLHWWKHPQPINIIMWKIILFMSIQRITNSRAKKKKKKQDEKRTKVPFCFFNGLFWGIFNHSHHPLLLLLHSLPLSPLRFEVATVTHSTHAYTRTQHILHIIHTLKPPVKANIPYTTVFYAIVFYVVIIPVSCRTYTQEKRESTHI